MQQRLQGIKKKFARLVFAAGLVFLLFIFLNAIFPLPPEPDYSTIVTDNRGEVVYACLSRDQQWRMKTELNEISPLLRRIIVAKEDKYFYRHPGINPLAIARAFFRNIVRMKRTSGASTITMQLARALEPKKRSYLNKCIEIFRAFQLEWTYSKDEILQRYLNLVPYGGNIEGVKSASILYFKKNPDHLSLAEITVLSIIPNRPSTLVIGKNNDLILRERNRWLQYFANDGIFSAADIKDAIDEPLNATRGAVPALIPHLANRLKSGGDIIHTHIDMNMQSTIEKLVADYSAGLKLRDIRNAAVVVINNETKQVVSYIGSANFRDTTDGGQVNGAAAIRQPGSTLKPLLYGLCIDQGLLTPKSIIGDVAVNYRGYAPENYDKKFNGAVTMEYALEHSLNIPAVKSLQQLGKDRMVEKLIEAGFKQVNRDQHKLGLSLVLGGCGASLEELTGLYSAFAADGVYTPPSFTTADSSTRRSRLLSAASCFMVTDILSKVDRPDFPINWQSTEHMPKIAWKTGTSYGRRDAWSIGYNKKFTVGVWTGNFSAKGVAELSGANIATPLLFKIFNTINYDSDQDWFSPPPGCDLRQVCSETGLPPNDFCTNIISDYFIPLVSPAGKCQHLQEIMVSADESISYCQSCVPANGYKKKLYKVISPDLQSWMEDNRVAYAKIPPHNPACEKVFKEGLPSILSPANGTEYMISKSHPEPLQLLARLAPDANKSYWYINNKFYKASNKGEKQFFVPEEGPVKISCTDDKGRNRDVWITVKYVNL